MKPALRVEAMEGRDCPSASITTNLTNGVLTVVSTGSNDVLVAGQVGNLIAVAGHVYNAAQVNLVVMSGLGGHDVLLNGTAKPAILDGGMGDDTLVSGSGHDVLYSGWGDNVLVNRGTSSLWGGPGHNQLVDLTHRGDLHWGGPNVTRGNTDLESQIIQLINVQRANAGLGTLTVNGQLNAAAEIHARDMAATSSVSGPIQGMQHVLYGTAQPRPEDRLNAVGYTNWVHSFGWGENIAYGFPDAASVVTAWMNSPEHRANILNPNFTEIGMAVETDNAGRLFFDMELGFRN